MDPLSYSAIKPPRPKPRVPRKGTASKPPVLKIPEEDFTKEKVLGSGSFGEVYTALWKSSKGEVRVAVKYFNSKLIGKDSNFDRELQVLSHVYNHDNVVDLYGFGDNGMKQFMVMELAPFSMDEVLHKHRDPPVTYTADHVMHWALQLSEGIHFIHSQLIIHRDIKPSNILLFDNGALLKMCDFGTAKMLVTTAAKTFTGTALYSAPEIAKGKHGNKCDIFSFAVTLWEMLTRHQPMLKGVKMADMNVLSLMMQVERGTRPPKVEGIPKFLSQLMDACWAAEPQDRPSAEDLVHILRKICTQFEPGLPLNHKRTGRHAKSCRQRMKPSPSPPFHRGVSYPPSQQELDRMDNNNLYTQPPPHRQDLNQGYFEPNESLQNTNAAVNNDVDYPDDVTAYVPAQLPNYPVLRKATPTSPYYFPGIEDELQPYVPVDGNQESIDIYLKYKTYLEQTKKVMDEIRSMEIQSAQISADLEEEGRKATRNAEVEQKHNALLREKEKLEEDLKELKERYRRVESEIHREYHAKK